MDIAHIILAVFALLAGTGLGGASLFCSFRTSGEGAGCYGALAFVIFIAGIIASCSLMGVK